MAEVRRKVTAGEGPCCSEDVRLMTPPFNGGWATLKDTRRQGGENRRRSKSRKVAGQKESCDLVKSPPPSPSLAARNGGLELFSASFLIV